MKLSAKTVAIVIGCAVFIGLPLLFYGLGDVPRRSLLKEVLSVLTLLAFSLMLGQFYLARSNEVVLELFKPPEIQKVHKFIAYGAVIIILLHPALIVLPRFFEAGIKPWDAFVTMVTTFDSAGVLLGLVGWALLLVVLLTSMFRMRLIKRFGIKYRTWRYVHGGLTVTFVVIGIWHSIDLGRHTDVAMAIYMITLAAIGTLMLGQLYWADMSKTVKKPLPKGEKS